MNLMLDGQSASTWIATSKCAVCGSHVFNPSGSSTYFQSTVATGFDYDDVGAANGSYYGYVASDILATRGMSLNATILGVEGRIGTFFSKFDFHGGLGLSYTSFVNASGLVNQLFEKKMISLRAIGIYLDSNKSGEVIYGGGSSEYSTTLTLEAWSRNGTWAVRTSKLHAEGTSYDMWERARILFHTPMLVLPYEYLKPVIQSMNSRFPQQKRCTGDRDTYMLYCYGPKGLMSYSDFSPLGFTFTFEGSSSLSYSYTIQPEDYITILSDDANDFAVFKIVCSLYNPYVGIGTTFLRKRYIELGIDKYSCPYISFGEKLVSEPGSNPWIIIVVVAVAAVILLAAVGFFVYRKCRATAGKTDQPAFLTSS